MERKKLALLVVPTLLGLSACGGDDTTPTNPPGNNGDAQADQSSTNDVGTTDGGRQDADAAPLVDVVSDGTPRSDGDAGIPGDAALESDVAVGGGTGLCNKAQWPYWITANFMAPGSPPYFAVDGDPATQFQTGGQQAGGEFIQIDFHGSITFDGMTLDYSQTAGDFPRGYKVYVSNNPTPVEADVVASAGGLDAGLAAPGATLDISFASRATGRYVRLMQTGTAVGPWWSIPELSLKNCVSGARATVPGGSDAGIGGRATWSARAYNSGLVVREGFGPFTSNAADMIDDLVPPPPDAGNGGDGANGGDAANGADGGDGASGGEAGDANGAGGGDGADGGNAALLPNLASQWQSGNPPLNGSWFIVDLGAVGSLNGVHITHGGGGGDTPARLTISLSTDDIDYTDVVVLAPGATVMDLPFGGSARFVRVVNVGVRDGGNWWSVADFSLRP